MDRKIIGFQEEYPTKEEKENALKQMTNEEINELIEASTNIYAKTFYSSLKREKRRINDEKKN